jgi:hypothetical protein
MTRRNVTKPPEVTLYNGSRANKRDNELSSALELLNQFARDFNHQHAFDVLINSGTPPSDWSERQFQALCRCGMAIGELMLLLAPHAAYSDETAKRSLQLAKDYADAIHQLEIRLRNLDRMRVCNICCGWFEPRRRDQTACSRRCAGAARIRRHRAKQQGYEETRKLKSAGVKPGRRRGK